MGGIQKKKYEEGINSRGKRSEKKKFIRVSLYVTHVATVN